MKYEITVHCLFSDEQKHYCFDAGSIRGAVNMLANRYHRGWRATKHELTYRHISEPEYLTIREKK